MTIKLLKIVFFLSASFFNFLPFSRAEVISSYWQTEKSPHFIIYYQEARYGYVDKLIERAERYYNSILNDLGFRRFDFWNWDNRAKIYLYKDYASYRVETGRNAWSGASVQITQRTIKTFIGQKNFFDSILPHEMTHIIFREFVGRQIKLPLWLDEGVACLEEKGTLPERLKLAKELVIQGRCLAIEKLSFVGDYFLLYPQNFYAQAASLVNFLFEKFGREKFLGFSCEVRDGKKWPQALIDTYDFEDIKDMQEQWKEFVLK